MPPPVRWSVAVGRTNTDDQFAIRDIIYLSALGLDFRRSVAVLGFARPTRATRSYLLIVYNCNCHQNLLRWSVNRQTLD